MGIIARGSEAAVYRVGIPTATDDKVRPPRAHEYPAEDRKSTHDDCVRELPEEGRSP